MSGSLPGCMRRIASLAWFTLWALQAAQGFRHFQHLPRSARAEALSGGPSVHLNDLSSGVLMPALFALLNLVLCVLGPRVPKGLSALAFILQAGLFGLVYVAR